MKDYYKTLEVSESATQEDIKKAFKRLAKKYHPDINKGDKAAEENFKDLSEAYEVLGKTSERKKYDSERLGNGKYNFDGFSANGPFGDFFNSSGARKGSKNTKFSSGTDFSDIFQSIFGGLGANPGSDSYFENFQNIYGGSSKDKSKSSYKLNISMKTAILGGKIEVAGINNTPVEVLIPRNSANGSFVYTGNKKIVLNIESCEPYKIKGNDIEMTICINIAQAVLGSKIKFKAPNDDDIILTVPPGTTFGDVLRMKGLGLAGADLKVKIEIRIPKNLTQIEKEEFEAFAKKMDWRF